jgi:hypothetical protein
MLLLDMIDCGLEGVPEPQFDELPDATPLAESGRVSITEGKVSSGSSNSFTLAFRRLIVACSSFVRDCPSVNSHSSSFGTRVQGPQTGRYTIALSINQGMK